MEEQFPKFMYWGKEARREGRFGLIKPGDVLTFTPDQAEYVIKTKDKDFRPWSEGIKPPAWAVKAPLIGKAAEDAEVAELLRQEILGKANDPNAVSLIALGEKTYAELVEYGNELNASGYSVDLRPSMTRMQVIASICQALRQQPLDAPEGAPTPTPDGAAGDALEQ